MEIEELLDKHRKHYIKNFAEAIQEYPGVKEVLFDQKTEEPNELYRLYRFDSIERKVDDNFKVIEFNHDTFLDHPTIHFDLNNVKIELNPIMWNGVEIEIENFNGKMDEVHDWIKKWIDIDSLKENKTNNPLLGVIHNFQRPQNLDKFTNFAIDLGSAETEALTELLQIITQKNPTKIRIHSEWFTSE